MIWCLIDTRGQHFNIDDSVDGLAFWFSSAALRAGLMCLCVWGWVGKWNSICSLQVTFFSSWVCWRLFWRCNRSDIAMGMISNSESSQPYWSLWFQQASVELLIYINFTLPWNRFLTHRVLSWCLLNKYTGYIYSWMVLFFWCQEKGLRG